jgi:hypothetical protein
MPATATSQTLFDGERTAIMKFDFITTDSTGETLVTKVDPSALTKSAAGGACNNVSLLKVSGLTHGLEVRMFWDATVATVIETIPPDTQYVQDYSHFGGLTNIGVAGSTGKVLFSTQDTGANDTYTVILEMQKHYVNPNS